MIYVLDTHVIFELRKARKLSEAYERFSADDVWSYDTQKFTRADDLGILPELLEMVGCLSPDNLHEQRQRI